MLLLHSLSLHSGEAIEGVADVVDNEGRRTEGNGRPEGTQRGERSSRGEFINAPTFYIVSPPGFFRDRFPCETMVSR